MIEKAICINLAHRTDRWAMVQKEFSRVLDGEVERFEAVQMSPGWKGCRASHLQVLEQHRHLDCFLVLEDDVQFLNDTGAILAQAMDELPAEWDMLYLGAHLHLPGTINMYSPHLARLKKAYCTHAMIFNARNGVVDFILEQQERIEKIDLFYMDELQEFFNVYITVPMLATQSDGYSDIIRRDTQYSKLFIEKFNQKLIK